MGLVRLWFGRFGVRELQSLGGSLSEGVGVQRTLRPFERNSSVPRLGMSFAQYLTILRLNRGNRRHGFAQIVRGGLPRRPPCIFCRRGIAPRCRRGVFSCTSACGRGASGHAGKFCCSTSSDI